MDLTRATPLTRRALAGGLLALGEELRDRPGQALLGKRLSTDSPTAQLARMKQLLAWLTPATAAFAVLAAVAGAAFSDRPTTLSASIAATAVALVFLLFRGFGTQLLATLDDANAEREHLQEALAALHKKEETFRSLAYHDDLTGLPNRSLFYDRLNHAIRHSSREGRRLGVLFLDLDDFKAVNDSFGHGGGDRVLVELANRVGQSVRAEDTVARLGGDEFVVLLAQVAGTADAARVALKVLDAVRAPFRLDGREVSISASVGVSVFPEDATSPEGLVRGADTAMYRAKRGRAQMGAARSG